MSQRLSRRRFVQSTAAAAAAFGVWSELRAEDSNAANEKLNIACVGTANRARENINGCATQNIVGLCDIDDNYLEGAAKAFPKAEKFNDFRKMFEKLEKQIDAVVVGTPDHIHAPASAMGMRLGKHCYVEKPMTHTVFEARTLANIAKEKKLATQLGTQIHAEENYRRVVEIVQAGAIGPITEVHVWVGKGWGGGDRPKDTPAIPPNIHWDLWLGPAPERPYHSIYLPANWRRWWDFGGGTLGDMGCHYIDLAFWAMKLRHPTSCVATASSPLSEETAPLGISVEWEFPAREDGKLPALKLTWKDGDLTPKEVSGHPVPGAGVMFIGEKGHMFADYGSYKLYPEDKFSGFKPPEPTIPRSIGHHAEWIKACKDGSPTTCNFDYSGALTETVLLGNVAFRAGAGEKITWDAENLKVTNSDKAQRFIQREYRKGWVL
jgi:predicted dehydrogenase